MSALQIRNLPDDIYQALSYRAERAHRSLAQQTVVELRGAVGRNSASRRQQVLAEIGQDILTHGVRGLDLDPVRLLREDRER